MGKLLDVPDVDRINCLLSQAQAGDPSVLPQLRSFLDGHPAIWQQVGDLSQILREEILSTASKGSLLLRESLARKLDAMEAELAGPTVGMLETLLVRRVVLSWALVYLAELEVMERAASGMSEGSSLLRRADSASRRLMQATKTLATVRRLVPPKKGPLTLYGDREHHRA